MFELLLAVVCVAANGFFVAAEFALAKVRPTALEALARSGDRSSARAFGMTQHLDAYLSATQLGITLASLGLGWLGEPALARLIEDGLDVLRVVPARADGSIPGWIHGVAVTVAFGIISFAHIVVGELVPKSLAIQRPEAISRHSSRALKAFYYVFYPALWLLNGTSNLVLRALRLPAPSHAEGKLSLEELRLVIQASLDARGVEGRKREILERVLRATDRPARAVMVPRVDMQVLSADDDIDACMRKVRRHGFSRYPIAEEGDPDRIVGYVYVKDLMMSARRPTGNVGELKRDVLYVSESRTVGELLGELRASQIPIAIVVDEYGGTSGLVTSEDLMHELVGEMNDEHHVVDPRIHPREDGAVVADGSLPMDELMLDGVDAAPIEGAETVSGYIVAVLGRLAHPGDRIRLGRHEVLVEDVRRRRVHRVVIRPMTDEEIEEFDARPRSTLPPKA